MPSTTEKKIKKPPKPNPKFVGKACEICGTPYELAPGSRKYPVFHEHHCAYPEGDHPAVTAILCYGCHTWLSGTGKVWPTHPFKRGNDKAMAPFWFALAVVDLYQRKLIVPMVVQELESRALTVPAAKIQGKETSH
jgi:hypothetical protein